MKKLFSVILCMALMLSAFAVPALADDDFCKKVDLKNVEDAKSSMGVAISEEGVITGKMKADKKEVNINFDGVDLTPYVDNGYLAFCIKMSKVPTTLRVYPYSVYTDKEGEHSLRPKDPYKVSPTGMEADKPFWIYLPLKNLINMNGDCKTSSHIGADKKVTCNGQYTLTSFGKLIIQPQIDPDKATNEQKHDFNTTPVTVEVKDLGLYVYKTEINGVSKDGYWMPLIKGGVTSGNEIKIDANAKYGQSATVGKGAQEQKYYDEHFLASACTIDSANGQIKVRPNAINTYGASFQISIPDGVSLPRDIWDKSTLRIKIASDTNAEYLFIGPKGSYYDESKGKNATLNAGGARPNGGIKLSDITEENGYKIVDIPLSNIFKGNYEKYNCIKELTSINFILFNTDTTTVLNDVKITDIAIYGPSRGLTVTNLQITKDSEETAEYSAEDTLTLTAKASNTTSIARSFSTIGAFYNGNQLAGVEIFNIEVPANTTDVPVTKPVTVPKESTTKFKAFAFSNLKDITPLCESTSAYAQIAQ